MLTKFIRAAVAPLALVAVLGACGKKDEATQTSRQVELAPKAAAQPQLADTARTAIAAPSPTADLDAAPEAPPPPPPAEPEPAVLESKAGAPTPTPSRPPRQPSRQPSRTSSDAGGGSAAGAAAAPASAPAAPTTGVIAGGVSMTASLGARVCTNTHRVGDRVTATMANAVPGSNGATIPAGAVVTLRVVESQRGENGKEGIRLVFEPVSLGFGGASYAISGSASVPSLETVRAQTTGDQAKKVAVGAAVGALAGQLLGKKTKSTVVGAAVGAAAGGAIAAGSADWNGCLGDGGPVTITLSAPVTVKIGAM